ncbi:hypothetical protein D3C78_1629620 [compost metagenome]
MDTLADYRLTPRLRVVYKIAALRIYLRQLEQLAVQLQLQVASLTVGNIVLEHNGFRHRSASADYGNTDQ